MNVLYTTIGGPMTLLKSKTKRFNGTLETYLYLWILSRNKGIDKLYIPANDWEKLTDDEKIELDPRGIVVNLFKEPNKSEKKYERLYDAVKDIHIDFAIIKAEYGWGRINIENTVFKNEKDYFKPLMMQQGYSAGVVTFINRTKVPYVLLAVDPRLLPCKTVTKYDTMRMPIEIMSQINYICPIKHLTKYADSYSQQEMVVENVPVRYRRLEPILFIKYYNNHIPKEKPIRMTLGTMQDVPTNCKKSRRFKILEDWIIKYDTKNEVKIFGRWDDFYLNQYPQMNPLISSEELDKLYLKTRYSFVIGIGSDWSTAKWAECLSMDVIPFIAPDYDTQFNAIPKDSWIRVKTPKELNEKMDYLDNNPQERIKLIKELKDTLFKDVKDGIFFYKNLNDALKPLNIQISLEQDNIKRNKIVKPLF